MNGDATSRAVEVLLVEDNPGDVRLTQEALRDSKVCNRLNVVTDGEDAIAYLRRQGAFVKVARPDLILLDLNLPGKDGRQVLAEIKADSSLRRIPVVVMTTSDAEQDIAKAYDLNVNCYVTKPMDFSQFMHVVRSIEEFWLEIVKLPRE